MTSTFHYPQPQPNRIFSDNTMELGSSPIHQGDDVEFDLDDLQNPFDDMNHSRMDEGIDFSDPMRHEETNFDQQDDDMVDEDLTGQYRKIETEDLDMDNQGHQPVEDEDVLYDEEEFLNTAGMDEEGNKKSNNIESSSTSAPQDEQEVKDNKQDAQLNNNRTEAAPLLSESHAVEPLQLSEDPASTHVKEEDTGKEPEANNAPLETDVVDFALEHESNEQAADSQQHSTEIPQEENEPFDETEPSQELIENNGSNNHDDAQPSKPLENDDEGVVAQSTEHDTSGSLDTEASHLHAVQVTYFDQQMSLFPPRDGDESTTFFLQDSSLAYENFEKLLAACREVLGDSLGHDDEIVFDVPALGLHICEDSKYASEITLAQVIDTYMLLSQNEQLSNIDPLYCQLSHRVCLASQIAYLANSAREGKNFSDIAADYLDTPEPENINPTGDEFDHQNIASEHEATDADIDNVRNAFEEPEQDQLFGEEEYDVNREDNIPTTAEDEGHETEDTANEIGDGNLEANSTAHSHTIQESEQQSLEDDGSTVTELETKDSHHAVEAHREESNQDAPRPTDNDLEQFDFNEEEYLAFTDDDSEAEDNKDSNQSNSNKDQIATTEADAGIFDLEPSREPGLNPEGITDDDFNFEVEDFFEANGNGNIDATSKAPPVTPSKLQNGKRRALDDSEDLEIDISTPEPKRRRAS